MITNGALVAITLMIAESRPEEKDVMINLGYESSIKKLVFEKFGI